MSTTAVMRFITVNIYLVCLSGKRDRGQKIYAIGGKIDTEQTAVRESDLQVDNKIGMTRYTVIFDEKPIVLFLYVLIVL